MSDSESDAHSIGQCLAFDNALDEVLSDSSRDLLRPMHDALDALATSSEEASRMHVFDGEVALDALPTASESEQEELPTASESDTHVQTIV